MAKDLPICVLSPAVIHSLDTQLDSGKGAVWMADLMLSPLAATLIFVAACLCGMRYRSVWKAEGPTWQLWLFGLGAACGLGLLAFVPLSGGT
ncbi:MAG: hypothetical protein AAFM92_09675 [Pseudomonadota bacterium]